MLFACRTFLKELEAYTDCPELVGRCFLERVSTSSTLLIIKPGSGKVISEIMLFCQTCAKQEFARQTLQKAKIVSLNTFEYRVVTDCFVLAVDEGPADL